MLSPAFTEPSRAIHAVVNGIGDTANGYSTPRMTRYNVRGYITARDQRLMRRIHRWYAPKWIRGWMIGATRGGDGYLWVALALAFLSLGGSKEQYTVLEAATSALLAALVFLKVKRMAGRRRPCELEPHCWASLLPPDEFSFPSGHTMSAFAISMPIMVHYPGSMLPLLFCGFSIAASRVVLGMHFLSDVLAGAALGCGIGITVHRLFQAAGWTF